MQVINYSSNMKERVFELLSSIDNLEIDDKIIENCEILQDNNDIKGIISYEKFNEIGLIRYFIFKRNLDLDSLALLYQGLEKNMRDAYVRIVIGMVNSKTIKDVFEYIGFKESNPSLLYFDETTFTKTNYKDSLIYKKTI